MRKVFYIGNYVVFLSFFRDKNIFSIPVRNSHQDLGDSPDVAIETYHIIALFETASKMRIISSVCCMDMLTKFVEESTPQGKLERLIHHG